MGLVLHSLEAGTEILSGGETGRLKKKRSLNVSKGVRFSCKETRGVAGGGSSRVGSGPRWPMGDMRGSTIRENQQEARLLAPAVPAAMGRASPVFFMPHSSPV